MQTDQATMVTELQSWGLRVDGGLDARRDGAILLDGRAASVSLPSPFAATSPYSLRARLTAMPYSSSVGGRLPQ
jgi:hypothetical protein